jgi:hypothetical protein
MLEDFFYSSHGRALCVHNFKKGTNNELKYKACLINTVVTIMMQNEKNMDMTNAGFIDVGDETALRAWVDKFDITKAKLKAAVNAVGPFAKNVERYLKKNSGK